jgi:hypothetical protein
MQNIIHNIGYQEKRQLFRRKLAKIAKNNAHNMAGYVGHLLLNAFGGLSGRVNNIKEVFKMLTFGRSFGCHCQHNM